MVINARRLGSLMLCAMLTTLALALMGVVLAHPHAGQAGANSDVVHVDGDRGTDGETCGSQVSPCKTIRYAVHSRVEAGGVVSVAAGTYPEQVVITQALTLQGAGSGTVIQSPSLLTTSFTAGGAVNYPIVGVFEADGVVIQDLVVDGAGRGNDNYRFVGVGYHNAGGTLESVEIRDVRDTPFSGAQHGVGLYVYNGDGTSRHITVTNCDIHGFQKNGLALNGSPTTGLTVDVEGNRIVGRGATTVTAQNGIQVLAHQGGGIIANNTVTGIAYDNADDPTDYSVATSILNGYAELDITGNTVQEGHVAIYNWDGAGEITDNLLEIEKVGLFGFGIVASDPPHAMPSPFSERTMWHAPIGMSTAQWANATLDVAVAENRVALSGPDRSGSVGITAEAGYGPDNLAFSARGNAVSGFGVGLKIRQCESDCDPDPGTFTALEVRYNRIAGNDTGLSSNLDYLSVDAMNNWWGCNEGPSAGSGDCDAISGDVDANPWLVLKLAAEPQLLVVEEGTSRLTADLTYNSSGFDTSGLGHVPDGVNTAFTATLGSVTPEVVGTLDGVATSTLEAGSATGSATVAAAVDAETVTTTVTIAQVGLTIDKTDDLITARPGDVLTYTLTITNDSLLDATGIVVTDTLPVSTTYVGGAAWHLVGDGPTYTQSVGSLGAGQTTVLSIAVRLDEMVPGALSTITNTARVADDGTHGPRASAQDVDVNQVVVPPDLVIAKTNGLTAVVPGQAITYTLTISNVGFQDATGVVVTDTLPSHTDVVTASEPGHLLKGVVTWGPFELPAGGVTTRTVSVRLDDPPWPASVERITNTTVVADDGAHGADLDVTDNEAVDVDRVEASPDLVILKDDGEASATLGEVSAYLLSYINKGDQMARGTVITETVPSQTTFDADASDPAWRQVGATDVYTLALGTLEPGSGGVAIFAVRVNETLSAGVSVIENVATIADDGTSGADLKPEDNSDSDVNTVHAAPDLVVAKEDGVSSVEPDDVITYTLSISNTGTQGAADVVVSDILPSHTTFLTASHGGSLSAGVVTWPLFPLAAPDSTTRTVTVKIPAAIPAGVEAITNTVSVSDDGANDDDLDPSNNTADDVDAVEAAPILAVTKSDGRIRVAAGESLTYTITVKNVGDQDDGGIVISDTLPAHTSFVRASPDVVALDGVVTWPASSVAAGESIERWLTVRVDDAVPSAVSAITNAVVVVGSEGTSDHDSDVNALVREAELRVTKSDGTERAEAGDELTYVITVMNTGAQDATGVVVSDALPAHTAFVSASPGYTFNPADRTVAWPPVELGTDEVVARTVMVVLDAALPSGVSAITNTAMVVADGGLSASAHDVDTVDAAPDLKVSKTDGRARAQPGQVLTYTLTVENVGTQGATGVLVSDTLPANVTLTEASDGGSDDGGVVTWPRFALSAGAAVTRTVTVQVVDPWPSGAAAVLTNTASVADDGLNGEDLDPTDNSNSDTTQVSLHQIYLPLVAKQ